jgi:tetratricopeptide (TPR) repeat protein
MDPLSPNASTNLGLCLYFADRNDEAVERLCIAITMDPDFWWGRQWLWRAYARVGRVADGIAQFREAQRLFPIAENAAVLGRIYADAGDRGEAIKLLDHLHDRTRYQVVSATSVAMVLIGSWAN